MSEPNASLNAVVVASRLAKQLESRGAEYAFGGAIALGYWGVPRGTLDVDLTIFLSPERPSECVWLLQDMGCELSATEAMQSLRDHGFCSVKFAGMRVNVFLAHHSFLRSGPRAAQTAGTWRSADRGMGRGNIGGVQDDVLPPQGSGRRRADSPHTGAQFDRLWVREQLAEMYGAGDPRLSAWDQLAHDVPAL